MNLLYNGHWRSTGIWTGKWISNRCWSRLADIVLPPELNRYYTDSIDSSKKRDAELYLTRFGLINIDEFDQVSEKHQGFLKHLLQMQANEAYQQRPLYEDLFFQYYRPASHKEEGLKISAGEIYLSLQKKSGVKLPTSNVPVFGRFLKKLGIMTQLVSRGRLYLVVEKS